MTKEKMYPQHTFKPVRDWFIFAIEWQKATGKLLMTKEETREAGLAKLEDAKRREEQVAHIGEKKE